MSGRLRDECGTNVAVLPGGDDGTRTRSSPAVFWYPNGEPYPGPDLRERSIRRVGMCVDRYNILSTSALAFFCGLRERHAPLRVAERRGDHQVHLVGGQALEPDVP